MNLYAPRRWSVILFGKQACRPTLGSWHKPRRAKQHNFSFGSVCFFFPQQTRCYAIDRILAWKEQNRTEHLSLRTVNSSSLFGKSSSSADFLACNPLSSNRRETIRSFNYESSNQLCLKAGEAKVQLEYLKDAPGEERELLLWLIIIEPASE